jgi:hypothetical protein
MLDTDAAEPEGCEGAWRLYFVGPADDPRTATFFADIEDLDHADKASARKGLIKMVKHAAEGHEPKSAYPTKCHEAFKFKHEGKRYTVWRIRANDVRIYFYYCAGKILLLPHVGEKREDKLTEEQKAFIAKPIKSFLDALTTGRIRYEEYDHDR